jgi:hypothetical protein
MNNNIIHKIQISVKPHFGDTEKKFENVFVKDVFQLETFEFDLYN